MAERKKRTFKVWVSKELWESRADDIAGITRMRRKPFDWYRRATLTLSKPKRKK